MAMLSQTTPIPHPPCPQPFNLAAHVLAAGLATPDKIALGVLRAGGAERWSYARLRAAVLGTGSGLLQAGLVPGDIVLMRLGNTVDFPLAYLGAIAVGIVPVPTSAQLTAPDVAGIIADLAPAAILRAPDCACPDTQIPTYDLDGLRRWRDLPAAEFAMGDPDRLAYVVYTSGTSGRSRAVGHAHRAIWARQMMMQHWYDLRADDRLLHAGAFNWTFTLGTGVMDPWTGGATALIPAPEVTPEQIPLLLRRHEATIFAAAPGVYRKILKADMPAMPRLRHGLAAGEKLPEALRKAWARATGTQIYEAYGMSECSTFVSAAPGAPAAAGSLGWPQPGRRVAILDDATQAIAPRGTPGIIAIHRSDPGLMIGYLGAPKDTAARFRGEWFVTGDRAVMQDDGQILFLGRDDDMMNAGGLRVSPIEVERVVLTHPGVAEAAATEVEVAPDVRVIGVFYTAEGPIDADSLSAHCAAHLARYKQPRMFRHVTALPRNANGKIQRKDLRTLT